MSVIYLHRQNRRTLLMKKIKKIFISALALILALCLAACDPLDTVYGSIFDLIFEDILGWEKQTASDDDVSDEASYSYEKPEYTGYDEETIKELCGELSDLADDGTLDEICECFDLIVSEFDILYDQEILAYLEYCNDAANEELYDDYNELYLMIIEYADEAYMAMKEILAGPCGEEFAEYIGEDMVLELEDYEELTDQELEWADQENELIAEYNAAYEEFEASGSSDYSELNETAGPIYVELVALRTEMAQYYGYENYAEYADAEIYDRDYSTEEAEILHSAVKEISEEYFSMLYGSYAYFGLYYYGEAFTADELIDTAYTYGAEISSYITETLDIMIENDMFDIAEDDARINTSFSTVFSSGAPVLFINMDGWSDFQTMTHELGHCVNSYLTADRGGMLISDGSGCYDILEIHSNGLEALYTDCYDDIFGSLSDYAYSFTLMELMVNVTDGAIYDEFQREVYENPDMTLDQINSLFEEIQTEYGNPYANEYSWVAVPHNFESPMYYISYSTSALAALQIWALSLENYNEAVSIWEEIVSTDAAAIGYLELLEDTGLGSFVDEGTAEQICMQALETAYSLSMQSYFNSGSGIFGP